VKEFYKGIDELIPEAEDGAHKCKEEKRERGHEEERVFQEFKDLEHYVEDETYDKVIFE